MVWRPENEPLVLPFCLPKMKLMTRTLLLLLLVLPLLHLRAQPGVWERWDTEVIRELHAAGEAAYLGEEEKKVVLFMNMARHDGPLFAETFLQAYIGDNQMEMTGYVRSLFRDLKKTSGLVPLRIEEDLTSVARGHAVKMGESGRTGHQDFNKRFDPLMGHPYNHVGENCSYGYAQAIDIVLSLLIDEGISDKGHRNNILNGDFNSVGVAIRPHKNYRVNCVIDFGHSDRSNLNQLPF